MSRTATITLRLLVLAAACALWQVWATWRHSLYFPPPSAITAQMYHLWFSGPTSHLLLTPAATSNILPSLGRVAAGLAIAVAVGVPLGIALGRSARLSAYLEPLLHFGRSLPAVAFVTVFLAMTSRGCRCARLRVTIFLPHSI